MTSAAYHAHPALAVTAEAVIPVLGILAILTPLLAWRRGNLRRPGLLLMCGLASIAAVYLLIFLDRRSGAWSAMHLNFSSHSAVSLSLGITLVAFRKIFLLLVILIIGGYMWVMVVLDYHIPWDMISTAAVVIPVCLLCHLPWWRQTVSMK